MTDVRMPDGRIIKNVPDGVTQAQLLRKVGDMDTGPGRSFGEELTRQAGLTVRAGAEGVTAIPAMLADPVAAVADKALELAGVDFRFGSQSQAVSEALSAIGVPEPATPTERVVGTAAETLASAGGIVGAAARVPGAISAQLAAQPATQAASAIGAGTAGQVAEEAGAGPGVQAAATLVGALAPTAITTGVAGATRGAVRGGEAGRQRVAEAVETFERAGTTPTVSQATGGRGAQAAETFLARVPGGAGRIAKVSENLADDLGANLKTRAAQLSTKTEPVQAGLSIERGVVGKGGFVETFKTKAGQLYDKVDEFVAAERPIATAKTQAFLDEAVTPVAGAERTSEFLTNPTLKGLSESIADDVVDGTLPYQAIKAIRSKVGRMLSNASIADDIPTGELKQLYGALSDDIATGVSGTKGAAPLKRADDFYKAGQVRLDGLKRIIGKDRTPEKIFAAAISGAKEGPTTINTVMRSLPKNAQKDFAAAVLTRMGTPSPGVAGAEAGVFNVKQFLTNWNKFSPAARAALFDRFGPSFRKDITAIAKVAENIKTGAQVFANPPGTASALFQGLLTSGFAGSVALGSAPAAGGILAGIGAANLSARLMANPNFVKWLAKTTTVPQSTAASQINALAQVAKRTDDEDLATIVAILENQ